MPRRWPLWCVAFAVACAGLTGCKRVRDVEPPPVEPVVPVEVSDELVTANTAFAFELFDRILRQQSDENVFVSPCSVSMALAMTYNGAAGEAKDAMATALQLGGMSLAQLNQANADLMASLRQAEPAVQLAIANSLWARQGVEFTPEFLAANAEHYNAEVAVLDFAAPDASGRINGWVSEATRGRIPTIVPDQLPPMMVLYLINATYFKGMWTDQFDPAQTRDADFTLPDGGKTTVRLMSRSGEYAYLEAEGFQAISLPYGDERISMYVFLPQEDGNLPKFCSRLTAENWESWVAKLAPKDGYIALPRFTLQYETVLNDALKALGMEVAFDQAKADFGNMCVGDDVFIQTVKHKTFVDVNEEGTEAAAATSVGIEAAAMPMEPFRMIVDRPFFCAIRDNQTGTLLFMGTIVDPTT